MTWLSDALSKSRAHWRGLVGYGMLYCLVFAIAVRQGSANSPLAPLWPPAGVFVAGVLLMRGLVPLWVILAVTFVAGRIGAWAPPTSLSVAYFAAACVETLLTVEFLHRFRGATLRFTQVRDVPTLLFATLLGVTSNGLFIGATEWWAGRRFDQGFLISWVSGFLGILLFVPLIIAWVKPAETTGLTEARATANGMGRMLEAVVMCLVTVGLTVIVFRGTVLFDVIDIPPYALSLPLIWAALRFDLRGVTTAILLITMWSSALTLGSANSVLGGDTREVQLLRLQLLVGFMTLTGLVLAAALAERRAAAAAEARVAEALVASERRLQQSQKMEAVGQLAGGIAHDFNNILSAMALQVFEISRANIDPKTRQVVQELDETVHRAASFTQRLLLFGRRKAKEERRIDLNEIGTGLARLLSRLMPRGVTLDIEAAPTPLWITGDASMMEQVAMNLVLNARDAMVDGGTLTVQAGTVMLTADEAAAICMGGAAMEAGEFAVLRVADTGTGIRSEHLPQLFEPFFTTKAAGEGTGLGLSTVFAIAQQHQGYVRVLRSSPQGTTFEFGVPLLERGMSPDQATVVPSSVSTTEADSRRTILLVEDHEDVRRMMQRILERDGFHVVSVGSAPEALAQIERMASPDLVLTDIAMPGGMSGLQLARVLMEHDPDLPIVFTSGYDPGSDPVDTLVRPGENFIPKPAPPSEILRIVREQLTLAARS